MTDEFNEVARTRDESGPMNEERDGTEGGLPEDAGTRPRPSQAEGPPHAGEEPARRPPRPSQAEGERNGET